MKRSSLIKTTSFKLSALYLALFLASFLAIGVTVYFLTSHALEQQLKSSIETEVNRLQAEYDSGGIAELTEEIVEDDALVSPIYGILDQHGKLLAGNFSDFKRLAGWQTVIREPDANRAGKRQPEMLYIRVIGLPNKSWLAIGRDGGYIHEAGIAVIRAFLWGIILVVVPGAGGGWYLSRSFFKKIDRITQSTEAIIAGDLQHRLPVSESRDELDRLALLLNRMLDKIGALIENVQQVSNDIAHDLRTPISRLKFRLEDALNKNLSAEQHEATIVAAIAEVDTVLDTFSAMLRISQIESGSRRSGFKTVNLSNIVASVTEALYPVAEEQRKALTTAIEKNVYWIGDKELLTQLVFNLLENAVLHTPENTRIDVSLRLSGNRAELVIADNGQGIAEPYRRKVFQRFYRLEQSRTTPGNGLGLSIVAAIADLHGATITLSDNHHGLKVVLGFANNDKNQ